MHVIGVDTGSASVRAGVFGLSGHRLALAVEPIDIFWPCEDFSEQSSENIWTAVCAAVRRSIADVFAAMRAMSRLGSVFEPRAQTRSFHDRKYRVFLEMHDDQIKYRRMMAPEVRKP